MRETLYCSQLQARINLYSKIQKINTHHTSKQFFVSTMEPPGLAKKMFHDSLFTGNMH